MKAIKTQDVAIPDGPEPLASQVRSLSIRCETLDADLQSLFHSIGNATGVPVEFVGAAKMAVELLGADRDKRGEQAEANHADAAALMKDRDRWRSLAQDLCPHEERESFVCLACGKDTHHGA